MITARKPYPFDISDEEWSLIVPYLLLMKEDAEQRHHDLRELFNGQYPSFYKAGVIRASHEGALRVSGLFWLTDDQMARLELYFPKSHGKP